MKWFIMVFLCILCWSTGDLCYKKGSEGEDTTTPLQFLVWLGIVMGVAMFFLLPYSEKQLPLLQLTMSYIDYAPFAIAYVAALLVGLMGNRFLDASVLSPLENIDGAISGILLLIIFVVTGDIKDLREQFSVADLIGFVLVTAGTVYLGVIEQRKANVKNAASHSNKVHAIGALALLYPLIYNFFDAVSMVVEGLTLHGSESFDAIGQFDFLIMEGQAFFLGGIVAWFVLLFRNKRPYIPFQKKERVKCAAALTESVGNILFAFAMAIEPVLTAPAVAVYCIFTIVGARIFLKEKMSAEQYRCLFLVVAGILLLGISEAIKG